MGPTMPGPAAVVEEEAARRRLIAFRAGLYACLRLAADLCAVVPALARLSGGAAWTGHGARAARMAAVSVR